MKNARNSYFSDRPMMRGGSGKIIVVKVLVIEYSKYFEAGPGHVGAANPTASKV